MAELATGALHLLVVLYHIIREDPRIGFALAILLLGGVLTAVLMQKKKRAEFPSIK